MSGKAWVFGDNLDTDMLAPGIYMKFGIEEIAKHCLEALEPAARTSAWAPRASRRRVP